MGKYRVELSEEDIELIKQALEGLKPSMWNADSATTTAIKQRIDQVNKKLEEGETLR